MQKTRNKEFLSHSLSFSYITNQPMSTMTYLTSSSMSTIWCVFVGFMFFCAQFQCAAFCGCSWWGGPWVHLPALCAFPPWNLDEWYQSLQLFHPAYFDGCDFELGRDWHTSVSPTYVAPQFLQPSQANTDWLPLDHSWVFHPQGECFSHHWSSPFMFNFHSWRRKWYFSCCTCCRRSRYEWKCYPSGFFNAFPSRDNVKVASQADPCNVENVNCDHESVVSDSENLPLNSETGNNINVNFFWFFRTFEI